MFSKMKPLPKALILAVIVGGIVYGLSFVKLPKKESNVEMAAPTPVEAAPENPAVAAAAKRLEAAPSAGQPAPAAVEEAPVKSGNVSNGSAGLDALLKKGAK